MIGEKSGSVSAYGQRQNDPDFFGVRLAGKTKRRHLGMRSTISITSTRLYESPDELKKDQQQARDRLEQLLSAGHAPASPHW